MDICINRDYSIQALAASILSALFNKCDNVFMVLRIIFSEYQRADGIIFCFKTLVRACRSRCHGILFPLESNLWVILFFACRTFDISGIVLPCRL